MIVIAVREVLLAAKITKIANKFDKKLDFVADSRELAAAAEKKPELVIANLGEFPIQTLKMAKTEGATVIGYLDKGKPDAKQEAEKILDVIVTKEEMLKRLPEILQKV